MLPSRISRFCAALALALPTAIALAGPYAPAAGQIGSTAVIKTSSAFAGWATGYTNYLPGSTVDAQFRTPDLALGSAVGDAFDIVSLGNAGRITLTFSGAITNGPGWDFAVFENSFSDTFLELAFVEVSSNGTSFFRFPAFSFTPSAVGAFGAVDPTNVDGLAGKYRQGYGTPFDLSLFANVPGIDVNDVRYVRIVDVVGNGTEFDSYPAQFGGPHPIYDPYPTSGSVGFDLDAVGVRYFSADPPPPPPPPTTVTKVPVPLAFEWLLAAALGHLGQRRLRARRDLTIPH
jgi:hypothetical protein